MPKSRRQFLADSSKLLAGAGLVGLAPATPSASGAATRKSFDDDVISLGLIGARSQGMADLRQALKQPGVRCDAICDVDDSVLSERSAEIEKLQGKAPV